MKRLFLVSLAMLLLARSEINAQVPFSTIDSVNINNINAAVLVHGDMWWNPTSMTGKCSYPNGSGKSIGFAAGLWLSGYDGAGNLHIAAQTYRQSGNDFWPGPLDGSGTLTYTTSQNWARIWKVNRNEIQLFRSMSGAGTATPLNTAAAIWEWPGKGNIHAKGNGGVSLTITDDMAPFVDLNGNGVYEPQLGDYPDVEGDQALWYVFSDNGPTHSETHGRPLGVEVHGMAYAYRRFNSLDNVIYYQYRVFNKSANTYQSFRIGMMADMELGNPADDYIGTDTNRQMAIIYNGAATDAVYGTNMPLAGIKFRPTSGIFNEGNIMYFNADATGRGLPLTDVQYDNYLRAKFKDGTHASNDFTGPGAMTTAYGAGPLTNYVFYGNPRNTAEWSECSSNNTPGDRRVVVTCGDMLLTAGHSASATAILATSTLSTNNACGTGVDFNHLFGVMDTAVFTLDGGGLPPSAVANISLNSEVRIYPNPAHDKLIIDHAGNYSGLEEASVYNIIGQEKHVPIINVGKKMEADISLLPPGIYILVYKDGNGKTTTKFTKN